MTSVEFHPEAEAEFIEAARYYEAQAENLGLDFISHLRSRAHIPKAGHLPRERPPVRVSAPPPPCARLSIRSGVPR